MNLSGKIAIVTGASKGIGKAIAVELAKRGAMIAIGYGKDKEGAEETLMLIKSMGNYAKAFSCDVSNYKDSKEFIENVINSFGKIDIVINNAGISKIGLFMDMTEEDWDSIMDTNLKGVFNITNNAIKHMVFRKSGVIINISSIWGQRGAACEVIYSASKGGINMFTKSLSKELAASNIRVNAIAPGVIETGMNDWLTEEEKDEIKCDIPLGEFGRAEDIAKSVAFLCSEDAKYITGQIITVDGGMLS